MLGRRWPDKNNWVNLIKTCRHYISSNSFSVIAYLVGLVRTGLELTCLHLHFTSIGPSLPSLSSHQQPHQDLNKCLSISKSWSTTVWQSLIFILMTLIYKPFKCAAKFRIPFDKFGSLSSVEKNIQVLTFLLFHTRARNRVRWSIDRMRSQDFSSWTAKHGFVLHFKRTQLKAKAIIYIINICFSLSYQPNCSYIADDAVPVTVVGITAPDSCVPRNKYAG